MKKKFLTFILSLCLIIPAMFMFSACSNTEDDNLQIRVKDGYVQWGSDDSEWQNVIAIEEILDAVGDDIAGPQGEQGPQGVAGKQVEFNVSSTHIKWRYVGDSTWNNLVALEDIKGIDGNDGKDSSFVEYTITYDYVYSNMTSLYDNYKSTSIIKSTEWITDMPIPKDTISGEFDGWYVKGTNKKIENYDFIGGNETLEARWKVLPSGIYASSQYQKKYLNNWEFLTNNYLDVNNGALKCNSAFNYYLSTISGNGNLTLVIDDSITEISSNAFCYTTGGVSSTCSSLKEVFIPETVTKIGNWAFSGCGLTNVTIPNSVTEIGSRAFANCEDLQKVVLPNNLDKLSTQMFDGDTSLMEVELPNSLTIIENEVFYDCISLNKLIIPASVTNIGDRVFGGCIGLEYLSVESGNTKYHSWSNDIIETSTKTLLYGVSSIIATDGSVTQIGDFAYFCNTEIDNLFIGDKIESVGEATFYGCDNLKRIYIASSKIANSITSQDAHGYLISNAETIYIQSWLSVENSTYLLENYTKQETSGNTGFDMYVKNS